MKNLLFSVLFLTAHAWLMAEESAVQAPPFGEAKPEPKPGLALTFTSGGRSDSRPARLVALFVPAGQPPTPFLPAGAFTARWDGEILSPLRSEYTFSADVTGDFVVSINGSRVLEGSNHIEGKPVQLNKGRNRIAAEYRSRASGDAMIRLFWASRDFPFEPIPPTAFSHDSNGTTLRTGERLRSGRLLFAELHCTACHDGAGVVPAKGQAGAMPELEQDAPVFADFGSRFNEAWLANWINDPQAIRPHTLMPRIFADAPHGTVDPRAADCAAFLASLGKRNDSKPADDLVASGGALFANLGCIACHTTPEFAGKDEFDRVPLGHLKAKWQAPALRGYLKNPEQYYRWTRMPNFRLSDDEADRLAAFLLSGNQQEFRAGPKGDPVKGAQLVAISGCLNCHSGAPPTAQPKLAETLKGGWTRGCMAAEAKDRGNAPDFALSAPQREALLAFAARGFDSLKQDAAVEFLHRQITNVRCTACHAKDGDSSVWSMLDNDIAPLQAAAPAPEGEGLPAAGTAAPLFTWLGEKLKPEWAATFIAGKAAYKPRPWLIARMPGFEARADGLARGLALDHGCPPSSLPETPPAPEKTKAGATLVSENGGFNCTTCHGLGDRPPTAVFEAPGINLAYAHDRIRHEFYHRWVYFPLRIDPDTKMPRFADDSGKTPLTEFFGGDAHEQFEAIWQFLGTVKK